MKIVFFGTPEFAARHLEALIQEGRHEIVAVVTRPDKPVGRSLKIQPVPVKVVAEKYIPHIPLYQPEKCSRPEFVEILKQYNADIFVVVAYGEIIKQTVIDLPCFGCINVHASALPQYRGAAPMQRALMDGVEEAGISIIQLVLKMDAGDILHLEKMNVPENMTFPEFEEAMCLLGIKCMFKVLKDFEENAVTRMPQDESQVTFAAKILPEECAIDWNKSAKALHNMVRAVTPSPGAHCKVVVRGETKRLKILKSEYTDLAAPVGTFIPIGKNGAAVACGSGALVLKQVQLEGSKAMDIDVFLRGIPLSSLQIAQ